MACCPAGLCKSAGLDDAPLWRRWAPTPSRRSRTADICTTDCHAQSQVAQWVGGGDAVVLWARHAASPVIGGLLSLAPVGTGDGVRVAVEVAVAGACDGEALPRFEEAGSSAGLSSEEAVDASTIAATSGAIRLMLGRSLQAVGMPDSHMKMLR